LSSPCIDQIRGSKVFRKLTGSTSEARNGRSKVDLSLTGESITRVLEWPCETGGISASFSRTTDRSLEVGVMDAWGLWACGAAPVTWRWRS
jgi:hypothetical protein